MNKLLLTMCLAGTLALASCGGKQMDESEKAKLVDSLAGAQIQDITAKATQDCEARMATEVKAKTDSIIKLSN
jgi:hypothetical protein